MLELRPSCEHCARELPPASLEAMICSYECTFCHDCVTNVLSNICPNCGGGFERRPVRPSTEWISGVSLERHPPREEPVFRPVVAIQQQALRARQEGRPPHHR